MRKAPSALAWWVLLILVVLLTWLTDIGGGITFTLITLTLNPYAKKKLFGERIEPTNKPPPKGNE